MGVFDHVSGEYKEKALVQQKAALKLVELLAISDTDAVIDVACGPGHMTDFFGGLTKGRVIGTDVSRGMIEKAKAKYPSSEFRCVAAEDLDYTSEFDVVFCNSSLQWFTRPDEAIKAMQRALKPGGKFGLSNPATSQWSPWFGRIISAVTARPDIRPIFAEWKNPWFFLPAERDYQVFFERCGFKTTYIHVEFESAEYSVEEAFNIYMSGAANGFASKMFYACAVSDEYLARFNDYVKEEIERGSKKGRATVEFNRLYYLGSKVPTE
jgi:ubiquinone/menaquinone biosynthesis C-methylase UbiE